MPHRAGGFRELAVPRPDRRQRADGGAHGPVLSRFVSTGSLAPGDRRGGAIAAAGPEPGRLIEQSVLVAIIWTAQLSSYD